MTRKFGRSEKGAEKLKGDLWLNALVAALTIIGLVYLYSATYQPPDPDTGAGPFLGISRFLKLQLVWVVLSIAAYRIFSRADFTRPPVHWSAILIVMSALLILVIVLGHTAGGAQRWISLGLVRLQPSEWAKIGFLLIMSHIFTSPGGFTAGKFWTSLIVLLGTMILIINQPDLGTALVFIAIFVTLLFVSKEARRFLPAFIVIVALIAVPGWFTLKDYQRERIISFVNPEADILGSGYNVHQAKIAVGSGGVFGKGLRQGTQVHGNFVPNDHTDFIFSVLAEEGGFLGSAFVIGLFMLVIVRLTRIGDTAGSEYQRLIAYGVSAMVFFQALVNISMNLGVLPVTGLPLPFFSYGGNSLLTMFIAIGICQSIYKNRTRIA